MAPRSTLTARENESEGFEREGTVSGLEDEGQIAPWELKQNGSVGTSRLPPSGA
jgi:hypothetical protein